MQLSYCLNPKLQVEELARLRIAVGWDARRNRIGKVIGKTYLSAACFDAKKLVGFVDVISDGVDDALVRNLLVHPDYQDQGIAMNLLQMVTKKIKDDAIKTINVLFEPELTELYQKAGFRIIGGGIIDNEAEEFELK